MNNQLKVLGTKHIGKITFTGIEGGFGPSKKAILAKDTARIHNQPVGEINRRINNNRKWFKDGVDIIDLKSVMAQNHNEIGFTQNAWNRAKNIYLLSERGYAKLLKILDDDKAWEIYDELVDNYFNMRVAVKENKPAIVNQERLAIMKDNSATRKANILYKIAMHTKSDSSKEMLLAKAASLITGEMTIPVMEKKTYTATDIANECGIKAQAVGKIANRLGLKAEQPGQNKYGRWANSKSQYSDKEVPQWLYFEEGREAIKKELEE